MSSGVCVCVFYLPLLYFLCLRVCMCVYIVFTRPLFSLSAHILHNFGGEGDTDKRQKKRKRKK